MFESKKLDPSDVEVIDAQASTLMKRGISLMGESRSGAIAEALDCFDGALALRTRLPLDEQPALRFGLAACWLNRAAALMQLGDDAKLADAVAACDAAIELLRQLPFDEDPKVSRRLAIAHQNRGLALQAQDRQADAIAAFDEALAVLDDDRAAAIADRDQLAGAVWANVASARMTGTSEDARALARSAALRAIGLVTPREQVDADAAESGLNARHILCRICAEHMGRETVPAEEVHEATDVVDEALALVRHWERQAVARFRPLAWDLFRFGVYMYGSYQPHFLREFIVDNTDPDQSSSGFVESAEMRALVHEASAMLARWEADSAGE